MACKISSVNDVAENMLSICRLFADDSSLQQSSYNVLDIEYKLNHDLQVLEEWSNMWLLKFNPSKTKVVYFSRNANAILLKFFFQGDRLECVQVHRHLDLLLSHNLSWSEYIFHSRKAYKKLRLLKNENSELEGNICQNCTYHL